MFCHLVCTLDTRKKIHRQIEPLWRKDLFDGIKFMCKLYASYLFLLIPLCVQSKKKQEENL